MTIKEFDIQYALGSLTYIIKRDLAYNPNTPKEILIILSKDEDWFVRCRVVQNPNTPKEILTRLSTDKDSSVRWRVACNRRTSKEMGKRIIL